MSEKTFLLRTLCFSFIVHIVLWSYAKCFDKTREEKLDRGCMARWSDGWGRQTERCHERDSGVNRAVLCITTLLLPFVSLSVLWKDVFTMTKHSVLYCIFWFSIRMCFLFLWICFYSFMHLISPRWARHRERSTVHCRYRWTEDRRQKALAWGHVYAVVLMRLLKGCMCVGSGACSHIYQNNKWRICSHRASLPMHEYVFTLTTWCRASCIDYCVFCSVVPAHEYECPFNFSLYMHTHTHVYTICILEAHMLLHTRWTCSVESPRSYNLKHRRPRRDG